MDSLSPHAQDGNTAPIPHSSGVYLIRCLANNKIYVGSAIDLHQRHNVHLCELRHNRHHNKHLQSAWNKYGGEQAFVFEIVELVLPIGLASREQYWFSKLTPFGDKGFNIAREARSQLGNKSRTGMKNTPEAIEASRLARTGLKRSPEFREQMRQAKIGKKRDPEAVKKSADWHRGRKRSPQHREKARQNALALWERRRAENKNNQSSTGS